MDRCCFIDALDHHNPWSFHLADDIDAAWTSAIAEANKLFKIHNRPERNDGGFKAQWK